MLLTVKWKSIQFLYQPPSLRSPTNAALGRVFLTQWILTLEMLQWIFYNMQTTHLWCIVRSSIVLRSFTWEMAVMHLCVRRFFLNCGSTHVNTSSIPLANALAHYLVQYNSTNPPCPSLNSATSSCSFTLGYSMFKFCHKGTTINDLVGGGAEEIEKKNSEALLQEKINIKRPLKRHSRGKNKSIFDSSSAPPPQIINGRPLN